MAIADISKAYSVVYKALDYRSIRQDMIASNIANVDTPFYRPKDVNFEQYLARENKRIFGSGERNYKLEMAKTAPNHLDSARKLSILSKFYSLDCVAFWE